MNKCDSNSVSLKTDYNVHNNETLEQIHKLASQERSLGCFICRGINQSLPDEKERIWVSLDSADFTGVPQNGRLHLKFNVNDPSQMKSIQGLFDRVVLDWSSLLCCERPYKDLGLLLKDDKKSELVIEALPGGNGLNFDESSWINVENGTFSISMKEDIRYSQTGRPKAQIWKLDLYPLLKGHLETLFEEVAYYEKTAWPYETGYNVKEADFFILKGPRVKVLNRQDD